MVWLMGTWMEGMCVAVGQGIGGFVGRCSRGCLRCIRRGKMVAKLAGEADCRTGAGKYAIAAIQEATGNGLPVCNKERS